LRRTGVEDLIRRRRGGEDGDTKLNDLLAKLADCPKARSASIHDRCKATFGPREFTLSAETTKRDYRRQCDLNSVVSNARPPAHSWACPIPTFFTRAFTLGSQRVQPSGILRVTTKPSRNIIATHGLHRRGQVKALRKRILCVCTTTIFTIQILTGRLLTCPNPNEHRSKNYDGSA
jgi:hypothetical protein